MGGLLILVLYGLLVWVGARAIKKHAAQSIIVEHERNKPYNEVVLDSMIEHANEMLRQATYIRKVVEEKGGPIGAEPRQ